MDRSQRRARVLILAALLLLLCGAADHRALPIRESRWLRSPDIVADLNTQPAECLSWPKSPKLRRSVAIGRTLFRSPLLLGGQAARAGLSCASCHRNGRNNPHFHFPGISGAPGTADVTASLMSEKRGDGIFNPRPIPDLAADPKTLKVKGTPKLRDFIHGLIVEEFTGPEPSASALDSVTDYVGALSLPACRGGNAIPVRLGSRLADVDSAVDLAAVAYAQGDPATGRALLSAARSTLGSINERFQLPGLERARRQLREADSELFRLQQAGKGGDWRSWKHRWMVRKRALRLVEPRSLFNPILLKQQLGS